MKSATPRAQLHLQRLLERNGNAAQPRGSGATYGFPVDGGDYSADSAYGGASGAAGMHYSTPAKKSGSAVRRGSSGRPSGPAKRRRSSVMSITRDGRSGSVPTPPHPGVVTPRSSRGVEDDDDADKWSDGPDHASAAVNADGGVDTPAAQAVDETLHRSPSSNAMPIEEEQADEQASDSVDLDDAVQTADDDDRRHDDDDEGGDGLDDELQGAVPHTIYDADGNVLCQVLFDPEGNPIPVTYDAKGRIVRGDAGVSSAVLKEMLNQRDQARRLGDERDLLRQQLEEMQAFQQRREDELLAANAASAYSHTAESAADRENDLHEGDRASSSHDQHTLDSPFLASLPEEGTHRAPTADRAYDDDGEHAAGYGAKPTSSLSREEAEYAETVARRALFNERDTAFLDILEEADASLKHLTVMKRISVVSFTRRVEDTPNGALVPTGEVLVAIQQEKEINELRDALAEASERIASLEETNTAIRLQLVLEKAKNR